MVPVPTDDARTHQGYCCSIRRLNRYCRPVDRRAGSNRIAFVLKNFWPSCAVRPDFSPGRFVWFYIRRKSLNKSAASRSWTERAPTRLGTADWVHTNHQPRSRSPSIVETLKIRNSWRRLAQNRNRHTTQSFEPQRPSQSRQPRTHQSLQLRGQRSALRHLT
jgi:hypothetical protein